MSGIWESVAAAAAALWVLLYELGLHRLPGTGHRRYAWRRAAAWGAALLLLVAFLPPVGIEASRALWAETLQFALLAFGVGPLAAFAAPSSPLAAAFARRAQMTAQVSCRQAWAALGSYLLVTIAWRVPVAVGAVSNGLSWSALEAVTVVGGTWWFWVLLVGPSHPGPVGPARRVAFGAVGVWSVWIFAYTVGFSPHVFYPAYALEGSAPGPQQWVVAILGVASALVFVPAVFVNLARWLSSERIVADAETARYQERARPQRLWETGAHGGR